MGRFRDGANCHTFTEARTIYIGFSCALNLLRASRSVVLSEASLTDKSKDQFTPSAQADGGQNSHLPTPHGKLREEKGVA